MSPAVLQKEAITRKPGAFEKRIHEIDFIRGVLIALVMMDHLFCWLWQHAPRRPRWKPRLQWREGMRGRVLCR